MVTVIGGGITRTIVVMQQAATPAIVTVTFNPNSGSVTPTSGSVTVGSAYGTLPTPTRTGYTFNGWFTAQTGGTQVTSSTTVTQTADHTLYARWTEESESPTIATVTYNANGGSVSPTSASVMVGSAYGTLPIPTRTGYTFTGWFTAQTGGTQVTSSTTVTQTADHTLYARWTEESESPTIATVTYNANGGSVSPTSASVTVGSTYGTLPTPTRTGYTFMGWFTTSTGGTQVTASTAVTQTTDHTLYARWTQVADAVHDFVFHQPPGWPSDFFLANPTGGEFPTTTFRQGEPVRIRYAFLDLNQKDFNGTITTAFYVEIYGSTQRLTHVLSNCNLPAGDHTGFMGTRAYSFNVLQNLAPGTYTITCVLNDGNAVPETNYANNTKSITFTVTDSVTAVTVTYNANGGSVSPTSRGVGGGGAYGLHPTPTRTGYTFNGWYTALTGGEMVSTFTTVRLGNHTLYARWTPNTYTVTFDVQGGSVSPASKTVTFDAAYGTLPIPTKTDWYFAGWWTGVNGTGTRVRTSTMFSTADAVTIYAYWVADLPPYLSDAGGDVAPLITTAYDGFVYDADNTVRGTLTLNAKVSKGIWTVSAKAILQGATVSFSTKQSGPLSDAVLHKNGATLAVRMEGNRIYGTLSGGAAGGTLSVDGERGDQVTRSPELYNIALLGRQVVESSGYVSLNVGNAGAVKLAGQLADGTKVSGSAKLLAGLNADGWLAAVLYSPLYSKNGFIGGLLWIDSSSRAVRVDTDYNWFVDWKKPSSAQPDRLDVLGGYFGDGKGFNAYPVPNGLKFSAGVPELQPLFMGGVWAEASYPTGLSVMPSGQKLLLAGHPSGVKITYTAKTGVFKGSFKLYCEGVDTAKGKYQSKAASVSYSGVMMPQDGELIGLGTGTATINKQKVGMPVWIRK